MKKQLFIFGMALFGAIAISNSTSAQTASPAVINQAGSFKLKDKNIQVAYKVSEGNLSKTAHFVLTNNMGKPLGKSDVISLELPPIQGFRYDLSKLSTITGMEPTAIASELIMTKDFADKANLSFDFPLVGGEATESNPVITFRKN